jgi:hypothetical protein
MRTPAAVNKVARVVLAEAKTTGGPSAGSSALISMLATLRRLFG